VKIISDKTVRKLAYLESMENSLIEWLQLEKQKIQRDIMRVKANKHPNEKILYGHEFCITYVGNLQNRILDKEWRA
jgi:hypothetical protein